MRKHIVPILMNNMRENYVEPFIGGGWIFSEVTAPNMYGSDIHEDLILMWNALLDGWEPPSHVSEQEYKALQYAEPSALRGFVGFGCSFAGKWFGGYARGHTNRIYSKNAKNSLAKKVKSMITKNIILTKSTYNTIKVPQNSVVYLDPPYAGTTMYNSGSFDHTLFYDWVRYTQEHLQDGILFISEYNAPVDFVSVLDICAKTDMRGKDTNKIQTKEKLFVHQSVVDNVRIN